MPNSWTFDRDLAAAGIAKTDGEGRVVDFHALRHTAITWAAASGAPTRVVQAVARHASIRTTERYTDLRLFDVKGTIGRMPLPAAAGTPVAPAKSA
jgi:integrase